MATNYTPRKRSLASAKYEAQAKRPRMEVRDRCSFLLPKTGHTSMSSSVTDPSSHQLGVGQQAPEHSKTRNARSLNFDNHDIDARVLIEDMQLQSHSSCSKGPPHKRRKHYSKTKNLAHSATLQHSEVPYVSTHHKLFELVKSQKSLSKTELASILGNLKPVYKESRNIVLLLVQVLCNTTKKRSLGYFKPLFHPEPSLIFFQCISSYICSIPQDGNPQKRTSFVQRLGDIVTLFEDILRSEPREASEFLPIDACYGTVEQLYCQDCMSKEMKDRVIDLKVQRDKIRQGLYQAAHSDQAVVEEECILPSPKELQSLVPLKKNIVKGPFPSVTEYVSIFYSLVREDFIDPLRVALSTVKQNKQVLYKDVQYENYSPDFFSNDIACIFRFTTTEKINWESSTKLRYGSLLCLSKDNFATFMFAIVAEREVEDLKRNLIKVKFIGKTIDDPYYTFYGKKYTMFESPTYYEAYAPTARALHMLLVNPEKLPFQNYLVHCKTSVEMPAYMRLPDTSYKLNLRNVICSCEVSQCEHTSIDIQNIKLGNVSVSNSAKLDQPQVTALCSALTKELALIQGPPGTGKTYIGLKIVESLLINKSIWAPSENVPIIIACYTNHALDHFLEGLLKMKDSTNLKERYKIRRLGGRSKSTALEQFNIKEFVKTEMRIAGIQFISRNDSTLLQKKCDAIRKFLDGVYGGSKDTIKIYSYFLSVSIIHEIWLLCEISISLPDFAKWGLKKQKFNDDSEAGYGVCYEKKSLNKFVKYLHDKVYCLDDKEAKELLQTEYSNPDDDLALFKYCLEKLKNEWQAKSEYTAEKIAENIRRHEQIKVKCLQEADVIGLTITGAAKYSKALTQVNAKICLIEEAAEVLEPHVISSFTSHIQHLILIGDHKQLRPKTNSHEIGLKYKLNLSLFERLILNKFPFVKLETQHRMRPEISCLISKYIYDGQVKDSESVRHYEDVGGMCHNLYFVDHQELEARQVDSSSPYNVHEAEFIVGIWHYLCQNNCQSKDITVITPYIGQKRKIHETDPEVHVSTLDNFQGEENKIILLSMVRSNEDDDVGFTNNDNRVCVAMSRAKIGFYCVGNFSTYRKKSDLWENILGDLEQSNPKRLGTKLPLECRTHKNITEVSCAKDFEKISKGGCGKPCKFRLQSCNHACSKECHPDDPTHSMSPCLELCPIRCSKGHRCKDVCGRKCPPCNERIKKVNPNCGHEQLVFCCKYSMDSEPCSKPVERQWPCGHVKEEECHVSELDYSLKCSSPCGKTLLCSHTCSGKCGQCRQGRLHIRCEQSCSRILICGHPCPEPCAMNCPPCQKDCIFECPHALCGNKCSTQCKPCPHRCEWKCEHYKCTQNCGEPCDRPRCNEPCKKKLKCGHDCIGLCGEPCPRVCRVCNKDDVTFSILFGAEDESDTHFVELTDCTHVIEANAIDKWVDDKTNNVVDWKKCPRCNSPIIATLRYANEAKEVLKDINAIKRKHYFFTATERCSYLEEAQMLCNATLNSLLPFCAVQESLQGQLKCLLKRFKVLTFSKEINDVLLKDTLMILQSVSQALKTINAIGSKSFSNLKKQCSVLGFQTVDFLHWIITILSESNTLTDQIRIDLTSECRRIILLREVYLFLYNIDTADITLSTPDSAVLEKLRAKHECLGSKILCVLSEDVLQEGLKNIRAISEHYLVPLTQEERQMIIKAVEAKEGSWYKCENGHYYQIGECGGAMEKSICPECKEEIGGGQHRLAEGNEHAGEFDGSSHAAWSEGANLGNYVF